MILRAILAIVATTGHVAIDEPVRVEVPASIAAAWTSFDGLPSLPPGPVALVLDPAPRDLRGRVDVLRGDMAARVWEANGEFESGASLPAADYARAILVRFPGSALYYWGEVPAGASRIVRLKRSKNLQWANRRDGDEGFLFSESDSTPLEASEDDLAFRHVPVEAALFCATVPEGDACSIVPATATKVHSASNWMATRLFHTASPTWPDSLELLSPGSVSVVPRSVPVEAIRTGNWVALTIARNKTAWSEVAVRVSSPDAATVVVDGAVLPSIPAFLSLTPERHKGVRIQPFVGDSETVLDDPLATLVAFVDQAGVAGSVPIATAKPTAFASFDFPGLASGDYILKLVSTESGAGSIAVTLVAGVPADVVFPAGYVVRGTITDGTRCDRASVEVSADMSFRDALQAGDLTDKIRRVSTDESGTFEVRVGMPGHYRLSAQCGSNRAERRFEIIRDRDVVDLGEIALTVTPVLYGTFAACPGATAVFVPTPEESMKKLTSGVGEVRRVSIDGQGRFLVEGLASGSYSGMAICSGRWLQLVPEVVRIPEAGDVVIEFSEASTPP